MGWNTNNITYSPSQLESYATGGANFNSGLSRIDTLLSGVINVKGFYDTAWRAAVGDGGVNDDAVIQLAITKASSVTNPKTIYFPPGDYLISSTMVLNGVDVLAAPGAIFQPASTSLTMVDMRRTATWTGGHFYCSAINFDGIVFLIDGQYINSGFAGRTQKSPKISDVEMITAIAVGGYGTGIKITSSGLTNSATWVVCDNIRIRNFQRAIYLYNDNEGYVNGCNFTNIVIISPLIGIHLQSVSDINGPSGNLFTNIGIQPSSAPSPDTTHCVLIDGGDNNQFNNLHCWDVQMVHTAAVEITPGSRGNKISGSGFEDSVLDYGDYNCLSKRNYAFGDTLNYATSFNPSTVSDNAAILSTAISLPYVEAGDGLLLSPPYSMNHCLSQVSFSAANYGKILVANLSGSEKVFTDGYWRIKRLPKARANYTVTFNAATVNISPGTFHTVSFTTLSGIALGDAVIPGPNSNCSGGFITCNATAANKVTINVHNFNTTTLTITPSVWSLYVLKADTANAIGYKDVSSLNDGDGETLTDTLNGVTVGETFTVGSFAIPTTDCCVSYYAGTAINTIRIRVNNETGITKNIGPAYTRYWIFKTEDTVK
jgi:hypothetical protein